MRLGQLGDGLHRERLDLQGGCPCSPGQLAHDDPERMGRAQLVVAICGEHESRPETVDPAADEGEHVQRRLVCPVQVVEDEDRRSAGLDLPDSAPATS
jgi:hypothetical protein